MSSKISALPAAAALTGAELVPLVQGGSNVRSTVSLQAAAGYLGISNSGNITLDNSTTAYTWTHGLGHVPRYVRAVLVCISADAGWGTSIGDEIDTLSILTDGGTVAAGSTAMFSIYASSTIVTTSCPEAIIGDEADYKAIIKAGGNVASPTSFAHFALKIYAL